MKVHVLGINLPWLTTLNITMLSHSMAHKQSSYINLSLTSHPQPIASMMHCSINSSSMSVIILNNLATTIVQYDLLLLCMASDTWKKPAGYHINISAKFTCSQAIIQ